MRLTSLICLLTCLALTSPGYSSARAQGQGESIARQMFADDIRHVTWESDQDGQPVVRIDAQARRIDSAAIPIQGGQRYELTLIARVDSPFVVEHNDRAHLLTLASFRHSVTSSYLLVFLDAAGEPISSFGYGARGFFLTEQWHRYVMAFYTPPDAAALVVQVEPRGRDTFIRDAQLAPIIDQQAVNLNPDFRYGELNYSGWQPQRDGRLYQRPDGVVIFRPGYGGVSAAFPLVEGHTYRVTARGQGGRINMVYFDEQGKRLHTRFLIRPGDGADHVEFTPPQGTRFGRLLTYGIQSLESCHVIAVSDNP